MSEENRVRYVVTNHQDQPVELHLATGVVVLEPRGETDLQEVDLATPQLQVLRLNRLITTRQVVQISPKPESETGHRGKPEVDETSPKPESETGHRGQPKAEA